MGDSRSVAFFADGKLKRIDIDGGSVQILAKAVVPAGGAWNRDGVILFPIVPDSQIFRVSAFGGEPIPRTQLQPQQTGYRHYRQLIVDCDQEIQQRAGYFQSKDDGPTATADSSGATTSTVSAFDLHSHLERIYGVDLTLIPGFDVLRIQSIFSKLRRFVQVFSRRQFLLLDEPLSKRRLQCRTPHPWP